MAKSVDPDETPRSAASQLGLYCLLRPVCLNTYGKYGILKISPPKTESFQIKILIFFIFLLKGVVGWCEGAVYLTSLGRPTDIGLQLGKACYPCSG